MEKLTHFERQMKKEGYEIIHFTHDEIMDHLLQVFERDRAHLLTQAAADDTKRHKLVFILDYENIGETTTTFGGTVTYNKKLRRFTHITYSDRRNWAVQFSIESRAAFFAYDYFQQVKKIFPWAYSVKGLTKWLLNN
jgi:hypothetical protein